MWEPRLGVVGADRGQAHVIAKASSDRSVRRRQRQQHWRQGYYSELCAPCRAPRGLVRDGWLLFRGPEEEESRFAGLPRGGIGITGERFHNADGIGVAAELQCQIGRASCRERVYVLV